MKREVILPVFPLRIVSLVPSQTELLYSFGLDQEVIGITKFCVHPKSWFKTKTRVGGTKKLNIKLIESLQPDLIIANKEENTKEEIQYLQSKFNVWTSDIITLKDNYEMILALGEILNEKTQAQAIVDEIQTQFGKIKKFTFQNTLYLIWKNPYMSINNNTFINSILHELN